MEIVYWGMILVQNEKGKNFLKVYKENNMREREQTINILAV